MGNSSHSRSVWPTHARSCAMALPYLSVAAVGHTLAFKMSQERPRKIPVIRSGRRVQLGGLHTLDDFAAFEPQYVSPIHATYRGYDIWECPPNGQGVIPLLIAQMLARFDVIAAVRILASRE